MSTVVLVDIEAKQGKSAEAMRIVKKSRELCLSMGECTAFEALQNQENEHKFSTMFFTPECQAQAGHDE